MVQLKEEESGGDVQWMSQDWQDEGGRLEKRIPSAAEEDLWCNVHA